MWVLLNILTATVPPPCNTNPTISFSFNLHNLARKDNNLAVLFDLYPPLSNLQSAHHAAALLIPKQLLNYLKCLHTKEIHPVQWGMQPCIFSNAHDAIVAPNVPSKTECSDNYVPRKMIKFVMSRANRAALGTDGNHLN